MEKEEEEEKGGVGVLYGTKSTVIFVVCSGPLLFVL